MDPEQLQMVIGGAAVAGASIGAAIMGLVKMLRPNGNGSNGNGNGNGQARVLDLIASVGKTCDRCMEQLSAINQRLSMLENEESHARTMREKHHSGLRELETRHDSIRGSMNAVQREVAVLGEKISILDGHLIESISRAHAIFGAFRDGKRGVEAIPAPRPIRDPESE